MAVGNSCQGVCEVVLKRIHNQGLCCNSLTPLVATFGCDATALCENILIHTN